MCPSVVVELVDMSSRSRRARLTILAGALICGIFFLKGLFIDSPAISVSFVDDLGKAEGKNVSSSGYDWSNV